VLSAQGFYRSEAVHLSVWRTLGLAVAVAVVSSCSAQDSRNLRLSDAPAQHVSEIIGGEFETGWPAVGAMVAENFQGYFGSFCTATLIDPSWVLTAAHCVDGSLQGFEWDPDDMFFFMGSDSNPVSGNQRPSGEFARVAEFFKHPAYNSSSVNDDIALVRLASPVVGVTPHTINQRTLISSDVRRDAFYVGFGVSSGITRDGGGVKQSTKLPILDIYSSGYASDNGDPAVCFGDSGGPGFLEDNGVYRVIGVNSTVGGVGSDPCLGISNHTRVDAYASWLLNTMGAPVDDCNDVPGMCACDNACRPDGWCDDVACNDDSCEEVYDCSLQCASQRCALDCYESGTIDAQNEYRDMITCWNDECGQVPQSQQQQCLLDSCSDETAACISTTPVGQGDDTCAEVFGCISTCDSSECRDNCAREGSPQAVELLQEIGVCSSAASCADDGTFWSCAGLACPDEVDKCFPPDYCSLLGGRCVTGQACFPTVTGATSCYPSQQLEVGESCSNNNESLACVDGAACDGQICRPMCWSDQDCSANDCSVPLDNVVVSVQLCGDASVSVGGHVVTGEDLFDNGSGESLATGGCRATSFTPMYVYMYGVIGLLGLLRRRRFVKLAFGSGLV